MPFKWRVPAGELDMELAAGLFGVAQRAEGALAPVSGWLVHAARADDAFTREAEDGEC